MELVVTLLGKDRPGIGADVLGALVDGGAGIRGARGGIVAGRFTFTVVVEADSEVGLTDALQPVCEQSDLELTVTPVQGAFFGSQASEQAVISCYGPADPAVLAELFQLLRRFEVNVEDFRFDQLEAGGRSRLRAELQVRVPMEADFEALLKELRRLEEQVGLESTVRWDLSFLI
ncbi:MAG: hypothetical protein M3N51_04895 [Actinomycetota bacterium]|nr:hypothetical protein [Actinomycetota bacterium]